MLDIGDADTDVSDLGISSEEEKEETTNHRTALAKSTTPPSTYVLVETRLLHDAEAVARQ